MRRGAAAAGVLAVCALGCSTVPRALAEDLPRRDPLPRVALHDSLLADALEKSGVCVIDYKGLTPDYRLVYGWKASLTASVDVWATIWINLLPLFGYSPVARIRGKLEAEIQIFDASGAAVAMLSEEEEISVAAPSLLPEDPRDPLMQSALALLRRNSIIDTVRGLAGFFVKGGHK